MPGQVKAGDIGAASRATSQDISATTTILSHPPQHNSNNSHQDNMQHEETQTKPNSTEKRDTKMSDIKNCFNWTTIDGIKFPYLLREDKKFVAVRMVEMKLLSKYPSSYPDELKNRPPLMSHYITEREVHLLNEINAKHCGGEYGSYQFTGQDLIVKLQDFEEFYSIVKKHFPDEVLKTLSQKAKIEGGWVQVNNTVVPFVFRTDFRFVPLPVIRYAAGLLTDVQVEGNAPNDDECKYFNEICKAAGLKFTFAKSTKLVMLNMVQTLSNIPVIITELPKDDPFSYAEYKGEEEATRLPTQIAPGSVPGSSPSATNTTPGAMTPPAVGFPGNAPVANMHPNTLMSSLPPSGNPYWMNPHLGIFPGFAPGAGPVPNPFLMQRPPGQSLGMQDEVNNNRTVSKEFPERPNSRGSNARSTPTGPRRSSTGTPQLSSTATSPPPPGYIYGQAPRPSTPSAAAGAPPGTGMPPPGMLPSRMMFPMLQNQHPSDYQKLLQMVQMQQQQQQMKSQGQKGPPPLIPAESLSAANIPGHQAPPNVTVSAHNPIPRAASTRPRGRPPVISADEPKVKPQHLSKPMSTAMANEPQPPQMNPRVPIKRLDFEGKSMACLVKDGACFALMEALSRVFFSYVPMDEFRYAVEFVLSVPVLTLTDEEERAFIQFYGLPTSRLKCNKAIKLVDFSQYLPQLRYMYKERAEAAAAAAAAGGTNSNKSASMPPAGIPKLINGNKDGNGHTNNDVHDPDIESHPASSTLKAFNDSKNKRVAAAPPPNAPATKKAKKRLDDMVSRLWSKSQTSSTQGGGQDDQQSSAAETENSSDSHTASSIHDPTEAASAIEDSPQKSPATEQVSQDTTTDSSLPEQAEVQSDGDSPPESDVAAAEIQDTV